ncbi:unnamed protein product [Closterium sp. NIES-64]|nr:unnamed protein product [Closterium sp. NIES-64]
MSGSIPSSINNLSNLTVLAGADTARQTQDERRQAEHGHRQEQEPAGMQMRAEQVQQGARPGPAHSQEQARAQTRQEPGSYQDSARHSGRCASPQPASPGNPLGAAASRSAHRARDRDLPTSHRDLRGAPNGMMTRGDAEENLALDALPRCPQRQRVPGTPRAAARRDSPAQPTWQPSRQNQGRRPPLSPAQGLQRQLGRAAAPRAKAARRGPARRTPELRAEGLAGEPVTAGPTDGATTAGGAGGSRGGAATVTAAAGAGGGAIELTAVCPWSTADFSDLVAITANTSTAGDRGRKVAPERGCSK